MTVPAIQEGVDQLSRALYEKYQEGASDWQDLLSAARGLGWFENDAEDGELRRFERILEAMKGKDYFQHVDFHDKSCHGIIKFPLICAVEATLDKHHKAGRFPRLSSSAWGILEYLYNADEKNPYQVVDFEQAAKALKLIPENPTGADRAFVRHNFFFLRENGYLEDAEMCFGGSCEGRISQRGVEKCDEAFSYKHSVKEVIMDICNLTLPEVHGSRPTIAPIYSVTPIVKLAGEALLELSEQGVDLECVISSEKWFNILKYFQQPGTEVTFGMYTTYVASLAAYTSQESLPKHQRNYLALATLALYAARENDIDSEAPFLKEMLKAKGLLPSLCELGVKLMRKTVEGKEALAELYKVLDAIKASINSKVVSDSGKAPSTKTHNHSEDFRVFVVGKQTYEFKGLNQAECIKALYEKQYEKGLPCISQHEILAGIETAADKPRLRDIFKNHPAWGTVIHKIKDGFYRLNLQ